MPAAGLPFNMAIPLGRPTLEDIVRQDGRFPLQAYVLLFEGLDYTVEMLGKDRRSPDETKRHVTGQELCEGLRQYALERFGFMAKVVLNELRITSTKDFGRIVFFLVAHGLMGKTDEDTIEDFEDQYDFDEAFDRGFEFQVDEDISLAMPTPYFAAARG